MDYLINWQIKKNYSSVFALFVIYLYPTNLINDGPRLKFLSVIMVRV